MDGEEVRDAAGVAGASVAAAVEIVVGTGGDADAAGGAPSSTPPRCASSWTALLSLSATDAALGWRSTRVSASAQPLECISVSTGASTATPQLDALGWSPLSTNSALTVGAAAVTGSGSGAADEAEEEEGAAGDDNIEEEEEDV